MAITQNTYTGDGTTVLFTIAFPYLERDHVKASLNGTPTTAFTFANSNTIQFNVAPANGVTILLFRETESGELQNQFFPNSSIPSSSLNNNFTQGLYVAQETDNTSNQALSDAQNAVTTANGAVVTANAADAKSDQAIIDSAAAVVTANTAESNSLAAVSTANAASSAASAAVSTANAASSAASAAVITANAADATATQASIDAAAAVVTANAADGKADSAIITANAADAAAAAAVITANAADANASAAVITANTAESNSLAAISTANSAAAAVASAVLYAPVADLAALALLTPADGDFFELQDSTGAESDPDITGVPVGLVGDTGLSFRLRYDDPPGEYVFLAYFSTDSETRYLKLSGGTLTGQVLGDNSTSASTPGFAFDGDADTGLGTSGTNELTLNTGGTARITIDSAGAVNVPGALTKGSSNVVTVGDTGTVTSTMILDGTIVNADVNASAAIAGTKVAPDFGSQNVVTTGTATAASLSPTGSSVPTNGVYLPAANSVAISTNGSERLRILSDGKLGLGTSSPGRRLSVQNSATGTEGIALYRNTGDGTLMVGLGQDADGPGQILVNTTSGDTKVLLRANGASYFTGGNVGIGTTSPSFPLHVAGGRTLCQTGNENYSLGVARSGATNAYYLGVHSSTAPDLVFSNNAGTERARLTDDGKLLVGTSSTSAISTLLLQGNSSGSTSQGALILARGVNNPSNNDALGSVDFTDSAHGLAARIVSRRDGGTWTSGSSQPTRLEFSTTADGASSPTERMRITNGGVVLIDRTSVYSDGAVGTPRLQAGGRVGVRSGMVFDQDSTASTGAIGFTNPNGSVGAITTSGTSTTYATSSDYRLKENVVPLTGAIDRLQQIPVHRFNFIADPDKTVDGFIAHEAQEVVPECVTGIKDEVDADGNPIYQGIDQSKLVPLLTAALQEAIGRIETLEAKVAALEGV